MQLKLFVAVTAVATSVEAGRLGGRRLKGKPVASTGTVNAACTEYADLPHVIGAYCCDKATNPSKCWIDTNPKCEALKLTGNFAVTDEGAFKLDCDADAGEYDLSSAANSQNGCSAVSIGAKLNSKVQVTRGATGELTQTLLPSDGVEAVIVKGGTGANIYFGNGIAGATLTTPGRSNGGRPALSHLEWCVAAPTVAVEQAELVETTDPPTEPAPVTEAPPTAADGSTEPPPTTAEDAALAELMLDVDAVSGALAATCNPGEYVGDGPNTSNKKYSCCAGDWFLGANNFYGSCATSSCHVNFGMEERNCFNYGSPEHPNDGSEPKITGQTQGGSNVCPYVKEDYAICDTSSFTEANGKNCRDGGGNHCLGRVKCQTQGVDFLNGFGSRGNPHSAGTADYMEGFTSAANNCSPGSPPEGTLCFYDGASENWKVCGSDPEVELITAEETLEKQVFDTTLQEPEEVYQEVVVVDPDVTPAADGSTPEPAVVPVTDVEAVKWNGLEATCSPDNYVGDGPHTSNKKYSCCAGDWSVGANDFFASCATSSCHVNFGMDEITCHNYGSPENPNDGSDPKITGNTQGGSAICPYTKEDKAICDTSFYNDLNGKNCREGGGNHCLGKVKCMTEGVTVPKNGNSDGTAPGGGACGSLEFPEGTDCFYNGNSENFKICAGELDPVTEQVPVYEPIIETRAIAPTEPAPTESANPPAPEEPIPTTSGAGAYGDPHILTWSKEHYEYHGACDLVLVQNPDFADGLGLHLHMRSKRVKWWSYIESAVLTIGSDTLEVKGGQNSNEYWINGVLGNANLPEGHAQELSETIGGFPVKFKWLTHGRRRFVVDLGNGEEVLFKTFKYFVRASIKVVDGERFKSSAGLMGTFPDGKKVARDGKTVMDNINDFGQEWQVLPSEPMMFHIADGPQAPMQCVLPPAMSVERRLAETSITMEEAEIACSKVSDKEERDECIFDVLATEDKDMAGAY